MTFEAVRTHNGCTSGNLLLTISHSGPVPAAVEQQPIAAGESVQEAIGGLVDHDGAPRQCGRRPVLFDSPVALFHPQPGQSIT